MIQLKFWKHVWFICLTLNFIAIFAYGQDGPKISFSEKVWNIGTIKSNKEKIHQFKVMNIGSEELVITQIRSSCRCLKVEINSKKIQPKEYAEIKATFKEDKRLGEVIKTIYIDSNDVTAPRSILRVKANVIKEGATTPSQETQSPTEPKPTVKVKVPKDASVCITLFVSEDCDDCAFLKDKLLPQLSKKYPNALKVKSYSIEDISNYDLLVSLEEQFGDMGNDIPVVFIGADVLGGPEEVKENLESIVEEYLSQGGCDFPPVVAAKPEQATTTSDKVVHLAYFEKAGCKECDRVSYILKSLGRRYPNLKVKKFNSEGKENIELFEAVCSLYKVPEKKRLVAPTIFLGEHYLLKEEITDKKLRDLIGQYEKEGTGCPWEDTVKMRSNAKESIIARFKSLGPFAVIAAGLVDGINPCAFATIIFFMSYLALIGRKGRELIYVGIAFTIAVFLTYFLVGLGVFQFIQSLSMFALFSRILYMLIAALAFVLGVLSLYDFIKARRGEIKEIVLQLPKFLKQRIHKTIREKTRTEKFALAAFVAGVVVSLLELACTGQVYLPTLCFVVGVPELRTNALFYLALYNVMFIIPLTAIFGLTYFGTTSASLANVMQKHVALIKLLTSILFFGLCVFLVSTLI
jgi:glutaredoxin